MNSRTLNNFKLGIFVLSGLLFLIILLYMIGKNKNMFGSNYTIKARFETIQGLKPGNNVRFAGIDAGTVDKINIINDTIIEVEMLINNKMKNIIKKNAIASIGTDGLVGNKVVNIISMKEQAPQAESNDLLSTKKPIDTDEMIRTLYKSNNDINAIAEKLKLTISKINDSKFLWSVLDDKDLAKNISTSVSNIQLATNDIKYLSKDTRSIINKIKNGEGPIGMIINDTAFSNSLTRAVTSINNIGTEAESLSYKIKDAVTKIEDNIDNGKGTINALLNDSLMARKLNNSLNNIEKGTENFNLNMEALKHSFLFRGYFKKLEKNKK